MRPRKAESAPGAVLALLLLLAPVAASAGTLEVKQAAKYNDVYGLEAALSGTCVAEDELLLVAPAQVSGLFTACTLLQAGAIEVAGAGATFTAGRELIFNEGFEVGSDAPFTVALDPGLYRWASVKDDSPSGETSYRASFRLRVDDLVVSDGDKLLHLAGYSSDGRQWFGVSVKYNTSIGENRLVLAAREDDDGMVETPFGTEVHLPPGWNQVRVEWLAGGGFLRLYLDDVFFTSLDGLDNDLGRIDWVRWGLIGGEATTTTGAIQVDDFNSSR